MEKIIIWIDDSQNDMEGVANGAFIELWKAGIQNKTLFFGDFDGPVDELEYDEDIQFIFNDLYEECVNINDEYSKSEYDKICQIKDEAFSYDNTIELVKKIPDDSNDKNSEIESLIKIWKENPPKIDDWKSKKILTAKYNVNCIFDEIKNADVLYALDLVLLKGDENKLNCDIDSRVPVISIELYHYITHELKKKCILYSQFTYLNRLQNNWKELYKQRYGKDNENINIIGRDALNSGSIDTEVINSIKKFFE